MAADRATYVRRAVYALIGAVVVAIVAGVVTAMLPDDSYHLKMHTDTLAGGIGEGTGVVVNGSEIGVVRAVSADREGKFTLDLDLNRDRLTTPGIITSTTRLTYAPKNLFGIAAVVLNSEPGGDPIPSGGSLNPDTPVDATLTTMLRQLSDIQGSALQPYVGDILAGANQATMAFLPILDIVGRLTDAVVDTEQIPVERSLPQLGGLIANLPPSTDHLLGAVNNLLEWPAARNGGADFLRRETDGFNQATNVTMSNLGTLLGAKGLGQMMPLMPQVQPLLDRILSSVPDARKNGLQIRQLIENLDRALPRVDGRVVLQVNVILRGLPGPVSALTGGIR